MTTNRDEPIRPGAQLLYAAAQVIISIAIVGSVFIACLSVIADSASELNPELFDPMLLPAAIGTVAASVVSCSLLAVCIVLRRVARERAR